MMNSKRDHTPFNRSVYSGQDRCTFIPNCSYEKLVKIDRLPDGQIIRAFTSDNNQFDRYVLFKHGSTLTGYAGLLVRNSTGEVVHCEVNPADRPQNPDKALKAWATLWRALNKQTKLF